MIKYFFTLITLILTVSVKGITYFNSEIKTICQSQALRLNIPNVEDSVLSNCVLLNTGMVKYRVVIKKSEIVHIGLKLLPDSTIYNSRNLAYRFIERKLLLYLLLDNAKEIISDLNSNEIILKLNNKEFGSNDFHDISMILYSLNESNCYSINSDALRTNATFKKGDKEVSLLFKKNYFNISGLNKIEADKDFVQNLSSNSRLSNDITINIRNASMSKINDSIFMVSGNDYLKCLSNSYYVLKFDSNYKVLYNKNYPVQSFISSILHPDTSRINYVILDHKQYGKSSKNIVELHTLIDGLKNEHELFFGVEDSTNLLTGTLIALNKELNYMHLFYLVTTPKNLFDSKSEYICKMYTFIPTDNILDLFSDKKMKNQNIIK